MSKIINNKGLIDFIKKHQIKSAVIGNGFSLSHPDYGKKFQFEIKDILKKINSINKTELQTILRNKYEPRCPETALKGLRFYYVECVLEKYIQIFCDDGKNLQGAYQKYMETQWHCNELLKIIDTIFTTNYDPLIYFEILKYNKKCKEQFQDGLLGSELIKQEEILQNLDGTNKKKIYYLHGSWFIQVALNDEKKLRKCSFSQNSQDTIGRLFDWENEQLPYLIFEDRSEVKHQLIEESVYLNGCLDKLKETEESILVFGLSFKVDNHISEILKKKKCYIAYLEDTEKENLKKIFKENDRAEFIEIAKNIVWDRVES